MSEAEYPDFEPEHTLFASRDYFNKDTRNIHENLQLYKTTVIWSMSQNVEPEEITEQTIQDEVIFSYVPLAMLTHMAIQNQYNKLTGFMQSFRGKVQEAFISTTDSSGSITYIHPTYGPQFSSCIVPILSDNGSTQDNATPQP